MKARRLITGMLGALGCAMAPAASGSAQSAPRRGAPSGAEIAQKARGAKLDAAHKLVAEFQGQPIVYTPAEHNASIGSIEELRGGHFLGVLETKAVGDESGLPAGTYNVFVAEVDGKWRAFAEANGEIVKEAARVSFALTEQGSRKPGFGAKGWYVSDPVCCVDSDVDLRFANTISLKPAPASVIIGRSTQLSPTVYDASGQAVSGANVTWQSNNPALATVSSSGVVQGVAKGTVTITATSGTSTGKLYVSVNPPPVANIQLAPSTTSLNIGERLTIGATLFDDQAGQLTDRPVAWTSSGPVRLDYGSDPSGRTLAVRAIGPGTATLTATSGGVSRSVQVTVSSVCSCNISFSFYAVSYTKDGRFTTTTPSSYTLSSVPVGEKPVLIARAVANDGTVLAQGSSLSLGSSALTVFRPYSTSTFQRTEYAVKGQFEAVAPGTAVVSARFADKTSQVTVTVIGPAAHLDLTPAIASVEVGKTLQASAAALDVAGSATAMPGPVTWASSDATKFSVSPSGLITGVSPGFGVLNATSGTATGQASIEVVPAPVASVSVGPASNQIGTYGQLPLTATVRDASGNALTGRLVRWSSSNVQIAAVDQLGIVTNTTGVTGTATITATSEEKSGTATVTVSPPSTSTSSTTSVAVNVYW